MIRRLLAALAVFFGLWLLRPRQIEKIELTWNPQTIEFKVKQGASLSLPRDPAWQNLGLRIYLPATECPEFKPKVWMQRGPSRPLALSSWETLEYESSQALGPEGQLLVTLQD